MKPIILAIALAGVFASAGANAQNGSEETPEPMVERLVDGNARPVANVSTPAGTVYFRYHFFGNGYTWHPTNVISDPDNNRNGRTIDASSPVILETRGLAVTGAAGSSTQYVEFKHCILVGPNPLCTSPQRFRFRVDPAVTATPASAITVDGSYPREIQLVTEIPLSGARIDATCTSTSGPTVPAVISVTPAWANTDSQGKTAFTITASKLRLIAPSGPAPSGKCTFQPSGGSKSVDVTVQGERIAPSLQITPSLVSVAAAPAEAIDQVVTVKTASPVAANVKIRASCSNEGTPATVRLDGGTTPAASVVAEKMSDAAGQVSFRVIAEKLVSITDTPRIRCNFNVDGLTPVYQYTAAGKRINPTFSHNPAQITQSGSTGVTVTMNPSYAGFVIVPSCTQQNTTLSATPSTTQTNASGQQLFNIAVNPLVITNPDTSVVPAASCRFGISTFLSPTLQFRTGNACAMALSPLPAQCGAPAT